MKIFLAASLIVNFFTIGYLILLDSFSLENTVKVRHGVLKQDVYIGRSGEKSPALLLPKGLTVKDVSPANQFDLFEPNRFSITVSSDNELVDYQEDEGATHTSLYSADIWNQRGAE